MEFLNKIFIFFISYLLDVKGDGDVLKGVNVFSLEVVLNGSMVTFKFMNSAFLLDRFQLFSRWLCMTILFERSSMTFILFLQRVP